MPVSNSPDTIDQGANKLSTPPVKQIVMDPEILPDSVVLFGFNLTDTLFFDFNCDDFAEEAFFRKSESGTKLIIKDGKTSNENIVGSDTSFETIGDNFDWVDTWGATADRTTFEILLKNGAELRRNEIMLNCFSIVLRRKKVDGGIVTFKTGTYKWINQTD